MSSNLVIGGRTYSDVNKVQFTDDGGNIVEFGTGGGDSKENGIIARTISGIYSNSEVTFIGQYAFMYCRSLTTVSFPACTSISNNAFYQCYSLTTISFPACTSIGQYAFYYCSGLTTASFPVCTSINNYAFGYCSGLTTALFSMCTSIGMYAFQYCYKLTTISFPVCTSIGQYAFGYCSSLTTVSFPMCTIVGSSAFRQCSYLDAAYFYWTGTNSSIYSSAFYSCWRLKSLYLLGSEVKPLQSTNVFTSTPISTYTTVLGEQGSIFVPASLLASYQAAANWSTYSARFVGLTDAEVSAIKAQMGL